MYVLLITIQKSIQIESTRVLFVATPTFRRRGESLDDCLSLEAKTIFFLAPFIYSRTTCANRAQLATAWSTGDTCTVCGNPTMSNCFTIYKIVAVLAFAYCSGYHCYYLSNYKLGVHVYCLWPLLQSGIPVLYPDSVYYLRSVMGIVWT